MTGIETGVLLAWATAATAVIGAVSAVQAGKAQEAGLKATAKSQEYNAEIERQNATVARQQANAREEAQRRQARQILGEQRAALSQAGIGLSGSAADVYRQSATNAELDALNIRYEGELAARGLLAQSELSRFEGGVSRMNAGIAKRASYMDAASSLLSGGAQAYGYYKRPRGGGG